MRRGIVASELGGGKDRVLAALDDYARAWSGQRIEACRATHVLGEQSGELLDLRMECLDRRMDELDALVTALASGAPDVASAVAGLVPLTACADATALREVVPLPAAPTTRARVVAVRAAADRVSAELDTGKLAAGYAAVGPLVREAEATSYAPVIAELELLHGKLAWRTDHMDIAEAALYHSIASAEAGRDGATAAAAWLALLQFTSQERDNPGEARRLGRLAQGAIDRYAGNPALASALAEQLGWIELDLEHPDAAEPLLQRAYDLRHARLPDDDPAIAASIQNLALVATARGNHAAAIERHRRALAVFEKARGPDHPDTLAEMNSFAAALYEAGKLDDALAMYRDGFARVTRTLGADGIDAGMYLHNIALVLSRQGQHADALASQRRALEIFTRVRGAGATDTVDHRVDLARMLRVAHQFPAAIAEYRAVLPEVEHAYGHDSPSVAVTLAGMARALIDAGHKRDAIEPLQRALAIREHGQDPAATQKVRDELAEAAR
jgi:eukaryotic-like serine/threonine-protein kinase